MFDVLGGGGSEENASLVEGIWMRGARLMGCGVRGRVERAFERGSLAVSESQESL